MRRAAGAVVAALLLLHLPAGAEEAAALEPDVPAGPAAIAGRVVHAESGLPVAGVEVVLYALSRTGVPGARHGVSEEDGRFRFEGVATGDDYAYLVGARYQGVPHPGDRVVFAEGSLLASVEVHVSDVTTDPGDVHVREARVRLAWEGSRLRVFETLQLENRGRRTYYVAPEARERGRPALEARLPDGAEEFTMPLGVVPEGLARRGDALRFFGPVHPGPGELAWSFSLAAEEQLELALSPPAGTERVSILVPEGGPEVDAPGLEEAEHAHVDGRRHRVLAGPAPVREPLRLALRLPAARVATEGLAGAEVRLVLHLDDAALEVMETHVFRVEGEHRVLAPPGELLAWIPLPEAASSVRFAAGAQGLVLLPDARGGLAVTGVAAPGEPAVEVAYRLPVEGSAVEFVRSFATHVPLVSLYLGDTGRLVAESPRLHRRRPVRTNDATFYIHLEGFEVAPGEEVRLRVTPLGPRPAFPPWAAFALVGLAAAGAIAYLVAPLRPARATGAMPEVGESAAQREREALYAAIADLDHDFETGKISEHDHRTLRDDLRARAVTLLRAERSPPAPPAPSAAPVCPSCHEPVRTGDRFCARCGTPLVAEARREAGG
jgi:hypothetical protein